jgi:hypothetical protein
MFTRFPRTIGLAVAASALVFALPAESVEVMHARVSYEAGGGLVKGMADDDWSYLTLNAVVLPGDIIWVDKAGALEIEAAGGTFVRLADESKVEVVSLTPTAAFRAWTGSFYIQRVRRSTGQVVLQTPACSVEVDQDSMVRVDIIGTGATTVSVRWGQAVVTTDTGGQVTVAQERQCYVEPGFLPSIPRPFSLSEKDAFDAWSNERARLLAAGVDAGAGKVIRNTTLPVGVADLGNYGEWVYVNSQPYWRPTVIVDYVPYRSGYWSYVPSSGYVWVGSYPFSYTTTHYGAWSHVSGYGWLWSYQDAWLPAYAVTVRSGPNFVWCPVDPYGAPVVTSSAYFTVGDVRIGIHSSSYCSADALMFGPAPVYPCSANVVNVPNGDVYFWNITITDDGYWDNYPGQGHGHGPEPGHGGTSGGFPYWNLGSLGRNYDPQRAIRGPETHAATHSSARARSVNLESASGRSTFSIVDRTGVRGARTELTADRRNQLLRPVNLNVGRPTGIRRAETAIAPRDADAATVPAPRERAAGTDRTTLRSDQGSVTLSGRARASETRGPRVEPEGPSRAELSTRSVRRQAGEPTSYAPGTERVRSRSVEVAPPARSRDAGTPQAQQPATGRQPAEHPGIRSTSPSFRSADAPAAPTARGRENSESVSRRLSTPSATSGSVRESAPPTRTQAPSRSRALSGPLSAEPRGASIRRERTAMAPQPTTEMSQRRISSFPDASARRSSAPEKPSVSEFRTRVTVPQNRTPEARISNTQQAPSTRFRTIERPHVRSAPETRLGAQARSAPQTPTPPLRTFERTNTGTLPRVSARQSMPTPAPSAAARPRLEAPTSKPSIQVPRSKEMRSFGSRAGDSAPSRSLGAARSMTGVRKGVGRR